VRRGYSRLESWGRWLGVSFKSANTPYERADLLATAVPDGKTSIRNLTQQFVLRQFSRAHNEEDGFDSMTEWRVLRPLMLRQSIAHRLERWRKRPR